MILVSTPMHNVVLCIMCTSGLKLFKAGWILIGSQCFSGHQLEKIGIVPCHYYYSCGVNSAILLYLQLCYYHYPWCEWALNYDYGCAKFL